MAGAGTDATVTWGATSITATSGLIVGWAPISADPSWILSAEIEGSIGADGAIAAPDAGGVGSPTSFICADAAMAGRFSGTVTGVCLIAGVGVRTAAIRGVDPGVGDAARGDG